MLLLLLLACGDGADDTAGGGGGAARATMLEALGEAIPASWSTACVTWQWELGAQSAFLALDPATGAIQPLSTRAMGDEDWDVTGLTWDGQQLLSSGTDSVARIDPLTGEVERLDTDLRNVVAWGERLLVERGEAWAAYDDLDAAVAGTGGEPVPEVFGERFTLREDYAWTTQPVADRAKVWHVPSGGFGDLYLDGFDGYVWGVSLVGDTLYLLNDGRREDVQDYDGRLYAFHADTGEKLVELDLAQPGFGLRGLYCEAR